MPKSRGRPTSDKITRTIRLSPEISDELDKYAWGQISPTIEKALRKMWRMPAQVPARDAGAK